MTESDTNYLKGKPDSAKLVPPPVREARHQLPFLEMGWPNFEILCARLGEEIADDIKFTAVYGSQGHNQRGIDINIRHRGPTKRTLIQARRTKTVTAKKLIKAVDDFLDGKWQDAGTFIYATAAPTDAPDFQDEIDTQSERLEARGIDFQVWGPQHLNRQLKDRPELVEEFFDYAWLEAFLPQHARALSMKRLAREAASEIGLDRDRRPILLAEDAGKGLTSAVRRLLDDAPGQIEAVREVLEITDKHAAADAAAELIKNPTQDIEHGSYRLWAVLARLAGRGGLWTASADAWEHFSQLRGGHAAALMEASIAAGVAEDHERAAELLDRARAADASNIKLRLEDIDKIEDHPQRLAALEAVDPETDDERALIECHKALAHLMLDEFPAAERAIEAARRVGSHLLQVKILDVNLAVHQARIDIVSDRSVDDAAMERHEASALAVRDELLEQRRWHEAARTLMLAVDAATVRTDLNRAGDLLDQATPDELAAGDGATSLAAAALRGRHWAQALRLVKNGDGEEVERIRATAKLAMGFDDTGGCRALLERLIKEGGAEATDAALALLLDAGLRGGPWSETAARHLIPTKRVQVVTMRAFHLTAAGHYDEAVRTLKRFRQEAWAKTVLFTMANDVGASDAAALAEEVLTTNPNRAMRQLCARALMRGGQLTRAEAEARSIAEDRSASPLLRGDAYRTLVDVLDRGRQWDTAHAELANWQNVNASDTRIGAWRARIGNRRVTAAAGTTRP